MMMKQSCLRSLNTLFLLGFVWGLSLAQTDYTGGWKGAIELPGMQLELSIHLQKENAAWVGFMDIPVQQVKDMKLAELSIEGVKIRFKLPEVPGNAGFAGEFDATGNQLSGKFTQGGQSFPMKLTRNSAAEKAAEAARLQKSVDQLRLLSDSFLLKRNTPGMAFGIIQDGKIVLAEGFGYRDLDKKTKVTANTQFAIGSSTKAFTAAILSQLADQGALDWEKPIVQYLPDFQLYDAFASKEMTAEDLVCHRSGLPRHDLMWYGSDFTRKEIYDRLRYLQPSKGFRTTWQYNNLMFMTAGYLAEQISGKTWETLVATEIFKPLGMTNSNCSVKEMEKHPEPALGYRTGEDKKNTLLPYRNLDAIGPAGSINSTLTDMLKWVQLHLESGKTGEKQVISASEIKYLHQPKMLMKRSASSSSPELVDPAYAAGWFVYRHKGIQVVQHGGNIDGFSALVYMVPEKSLGMVVLTNQDGADITDLITRYATDLLLDLGYTDWYARAFGEDDTKKKEEEDEKKPSPKRIAGTKAGHEPSDYIGAYEHPGYGILEVSKAKKDLQVHINSFIMPLEHWHYDVFRAEEKALGASFLLNFQTDENGSVYQVKINLDPTVDDIVFKKIAPKRLSDPVFLAQLTGQYLLKEAEQTVTIELKNAILYATVPGQPTYTLLPYQGTEFKLKGLNGYSVEFMLDDKGKAKVISFIQPEGVFKAERKDK